MSTATVQAQPILPLVERPAWKELKSHYKKARAFSLRKLFKDDPKRGERLILEAVGLFLDYSKNAETVAKRPAAVVAEHARAAFGARRGRRENWSCR